VKNWTPGEIKTFKNTYGLSQKRLSDLLGVSRTHVYYLEKGVRGPSRTLKLLLGYIEEKLEKKSDKK